MSRRLVAKCIDRFQCGIEAVERRPQLREQPFADLAQSNAARGAIEEPHPELFLQAPDGFAERRTGNAEVDRGLGEARMLGGRHEGVHLCKSQFAHWSVSPISSSG